MSILEKKIIQIGFKDITNYEQLVNLSFPTLFTFESSEQSYIDFTNQYKPKKGILEFILSPSNKQKIKDYLNNNTTVDQLFNNKKIIQYKFNKAELTVKKINVENLKNISPSKELTYNNPFNMIYKEK